MIAIIDYGVGNLFSLSASLAHQGIPYTITRKPEEIEQADALILPGVGAFGDAAKRLQDSGLDQVIHKQTQKGIPLLGICLGMQLLFEKSYEYGEHKGLGLLPGVVCPLRPDLPREDALVPHMGWNRLHIVKDDPILAPLPENRHMYFVHSFYAKQCQEVLLADAEYESIRVPAIVGRGRVYGMQFHPEKSGAAGLQLLTNFARLLSR